MKISCEILILLIPILILSTMTKGNLANNKGADSISEDYDHEAQGTDTEATELASIDIEPEIIEGSKYGPPFPYGLKTFKLLPQPPPLPINGWGWSPQIQQFPFRINLPPPGLGFPPGFGWPGPQPIVPLPGWGWPGRFPFRR